MSMGMLLSARLRCGDPAVLPEAVGSMTGVGLEPGGFGRQRSSTLAGEAEVAARPAVDDLLAVDGDQSLPLQPLERGVERGDLQRDAAVREPAHLAEQGVAVTPALGEGVEHP